MQEQNSFILMDRQEFHDWLFSTPFDRTINIIQQHHTWSPNYSNFNGSNHFQMLNGMKNYHLSIGYSNIAQNLTIFPDGMIAICRPFDVAPAGIMGANSNGLCIENVGNFDIGGDIMNSEHKKSIIYVNAILCMRFGLEPNTDTIQYHHWWDLNTGARTDGSGSTKTCPGTNWFGGNTVEDCQNNLIPLIKHQIDIETGMVLPEEPITIVEPIQEEIPVIFNDFDNISNWAKEDVAKLKEIGIFEGDDNGNFNPQTQITKEQLAVVIGRLLKYLNKQ